MNIQFNISVKKLKSINLSLSTLCDGRCIFCPERGDYKNLHMKLETAKKMFMEVYHKGDIYLGKYEGWYNTREEKFVTEEEAKEHNYIDPVSKVAYQRLKEPSYFFKMEPYRHRLIEYINEHNDFISDIHRKAYILKRLEEPLHDLSISRTTFNWGVPVPNVNDTPDEHVMYVWFDALTNYLSGIDYFSLYDKVNRCWPAIHLIGQDILWFHSVIWPCMLFSAGIPLPKSIIVHGFINDEEGRKMSKSIGNVVDPFKLLECYNSDLIRYYLIRGGVYGSDFKFSEANLKEKNNSELADLYGNLVRRIFSMTERYFDSQIPQITDNLDHVTLSTFNLEILVSIDDQFISGHPDIALEIIVNQLQDANRWLYVMEPWKVKESTEKGKIIRIALEKLYIITHLLHPYIPDSCNIVFRQFRQGPQKIGELKEYNLTDHKIECNNSILFHKI